jgi:hypothetical protein
MKKFRELTEDQIKAVKPTLKIFKNNYRNPKHPWYANNPFLKYLVQWIIYWSIFYEPLQKKDKFKAGDKVKYNWKALVQIYSTGGKDMFKTRTVKKLTWYKNLEFTDGTGCDPFWVRKIYFWEK